MEADHPGHQGLPYQCRGQGDPDSPPHIALPSTQHHPHAQPRARLGLERFGSILTRLALYIRVSARPPLRPTVSGGAHSRVQRAGAQHQLWLVLLQVLKLDAEPGCESMQRACLLYVKVQLAFHHLCSRQRVRSGC